MSRCRIARKIVVLLIRQHDKFRMMLNEEFRRPLDETRATQGTKAYLQMRDGPFQPEPFGPRSKKKAG